MIARAPAVARLPQRIDHQRSDAKALQPRRQHEAIMPATDDESIRLDALAQRRGGVRALVTPCPPALGGFMRDALRPARPADLLMAD